MDIKKYFKETKKYYWLELLKHFSIFFLCAVLITLALIYKIEYLIILAFVVSAVPFFLFLIAVKHIILVYWFAKGVLWHINEVLNFGNVISYDGVPGAGKTLSMSFDGLILSIDVYQNLMLKYLIRHGRFKNPVEITENRFNDYDDYLRWELEKQTVEYYIDNSAYIPLLISNYGIKFNEQFSAILKPAHFLQEERLPECAVCLFDESADFLTNQRSFAKHNTMEYFENLLVAETTSKERHYGEWKLLFAEQDSSENFIAIRRVVSRYRNLDEKIKKVLQPKRLLRKVEKLCDKILKNCNCTFGEYLKYSKLTSRISKIGFFKIHYSDRLKFDGQIFDIGYFFLPINLPFKYETRAYCFDYKALSKIIEVEQHLSLYKCDN